LQLVSVARGAAQVTDTFGNFYLAKNHNIANNSTTTEARGKKLAQIWNP
jgi:hypothetical protein